MFDAKKLVLEPKSAEALVFERELDAHVPALQPKVLCEDTLLNPIRVAYVVDASTLVG